MIYIEMTASTAWDYLRFSDYRKTWSYEGFKKLFVYLEDLSDNLGDPIELDFISWCCDYSEMTLEDLISEYFEGDFINYLGDVDLSGERPADQMESFLEDVRGGFISSRLQDYYAERVIDRIALKGSPDKYLVFEDSERPSK